MKPATYIGPVPADSLTTVTDHRDLTALSIRTAELADAPQIHHLVAESGILDANSLYCYLLLCRDFADTIVVATRDTQVVGFVTAYRPPEHPDTVFVWQVGVAEAVRRQGLAKRLLHNLVTLPACREVRFLEATVTPSNAASRQLFEAFARDLGADCHIRQGFTTEMFGDGNHETEQLFRIGPFATTTQEI